MSTKNEHFQKVWSQFKDEVGITEYQAGVLFEHGYKAKEEEKAQLTNLSLSDLKILIKDFHDSMEGCRCENGELDSDGQLYNEKLEKLWKIYDSKVEALSHQIVI